MKNNSAPKSIAALAKEVRRGKLRQIQLVVDSSNEQIADICRNFGVRPTEFYKYRKAMKEKL
jgi:hypothetical protein